MTLRAVVFIRIICDSCGNVYSVRSEQHADVPRKIAARREAHQDGWRRTGSSGRWLDWCPSCVNLRERGLLAGQEVIV